MNNSLSIDEIIKGCAKGKRIYQKKIYELYYGKLFGICLRYAKDKDEAKDILQDGFIKIFSKINKYNYKGSFEGWMRRIVVNTAIDYFRKNKREPLIFDGELENNLQNEIVEEIKIDKYERISQESIIQSVQKLSPACRTVFNLYILEGYSHKEIAEILKISVGTSKSNLSKAKEKLKKILSCYIAEYSHQV